MTLDQLRSFRAVAKRQSFTRAAEELNLTQPAVSAQIVALEREYGNRFFDRVGKRVEITEAGRIVLVAAEDILRRVDEISKELEDLAGLCVGRLNIGASLIVGIYLLPEAMGLFKKAHPLLELSLKIEYARKIVELVSAGEIEVGIIGEGSPIRDERILVEPFARDELVVIVNPHHPWASLKSIAADDLAGEPFIISEKGSATQELIMGRLGAAKTYLTIAMELGNIEAVKRAVEADLGISIMSQRAVARDLQEGRLKALRLADLSLERNLSFVRRRERHVSSAARAFMDFFASSVDGRLAPPDL